jgi:hypothetical protein
MKVYIDDGHPKGNVNGGSQGYKEEQGNLKSARYLQNILESSGIEVRVSNDIYDGDSLTRRGQEAVKWGANVFFSIHSNAGGGQGSECYYSIRLPSDRVYAQLISDSISKEFGVKNRGAKFKESVKYPGYDFLTVIATAQKGGVPHVFLVESMFHDNLVEESLLLQDETHRKLASIYADMIFKLLGISGSASLPNRGATTNVNVEVKVESNIDKARSYVGIRCRELQTKLNQAGYDCGAADGILGQNTYNALIRFQSENGLSADGLAGAKTFAKLEEKIARSYPVLRQGATGKYVKIAQQHLLDKGYGLGKSGADGDFGSKTNKAIRIFQENKGLKIDGVIGIATWSELVK